VVVCDFNFVGISVLPPETNPELVIDADAVLPSAVAFQPFEAIARGDAQLAEVAHPIELREFTPDHRPERRGTGSARLATAEAIEEILGGAIREGAYHA
jgi:hypothetical protein